MTRLTPTCLLLDLDGTLVDSGPGISASVTKALLSVGADIPEAPTLRTFIGPPMYESFRHVLGLDESTARRALERYRTEYAETGALDSRPYDGIPALLDALAGAGLPMAVATSKVEDQAERITRHHGLASRLVTVCGTSDGAGRETKRAVIRECLDRFRTYGVDISRPLMVGDRGYDVDSAAAEGIATIHVRWGYGDPAEAAGAVASADSPEMLAKMLLDATLRPGQASPAPS
ncbi:HAD hydrolase-like protein [Saccharopolyspora pogona]|uniref:HAD hydrolase-like protein n=1 Tax=Saccharopolyspora pogona TaxID=333966 RepID=UPI0016827CC9|nr:HAD hydrolase-like protein [Saccharopolyspora pogona]